MSLKDFLTSRVFLKHLILSILLVLIIIVFTLQRLKSYTQHGQSFPVPDFTGLTIQEIKPIAEQNDMQFEVIDSVHFDGAKPGVVVEQVPKANAKVKRNRVVLLTINSTVPEKVTLPKLTDISFRQAQALIENCGIVLGNISYEPSEYNNLVLKVEQNANELNQGDIIFKGSSVDLIIGSSSGNQDTPLPNLTGLTLTSADSLLKNNFLITGVVIYDGTVITTEDTLSAFVWKQYPSIKNARIVSLGTSVDLWFTLDSLKIQQAATQVTE
ncbi:MAG: PASTA domain-containing protein [Bacteroidetes bacterium]|nr:MAG: PASTA domain-containing protein [Bacteroidota bacterium]